VLRTDFDTCNAVSAGGFLSGKRFSARISFHRQGAKNWCRSGARCVFLFADDTPISITDSHDELAERIYHPRRGSLVGGRAKTKNLFTKETRRKPVRAKFIVSHAGGACSRSGPTTRERQDRIISRLEHDPGKKAGHAF